jgi:hypothetical protein
MNMRLKYLLATILTTLLVPGWSFAQKINYTEPDNKDGRNTLFEIIGRFSNSNILIYKNNRNDNDITVYDNDMQQKQKVKLDFIPDRLINIDFVSYPDFCYLIYQFERKGVVHCMGMKMGSDGQKLSEPFEMDTTRIGVGSNNIYTTVVSEDKQKIVVFKINTKNQRNYLFTTVLFNAQLELLRKSRMTVKMDERNDFLTEFNVDNEGDLVFGKYVRNNSNEYINRVMLMTKPADQDTIISQDLDIGGRYLDEVKIKVDNRNKRYILNSFYYKQRRGNIEGLYTFVWDKQNNKKLADNLTTLSDELKAQAKSKDASVKGALNDFFIRHIIPRKDGGFMLISESLYSTTRGGNNWNRWDMLYGNPWYSPLDYYSPFNNFGWGNNGWNPYGYGNRFNNNTTRYYAENILVLSFNKDGVMEWSNVIPKSQFEDDQDITVSYQLVNTGGQLHFLFNQSERRNLLLNDQSISPDGQITRNPTLKNLDRGYQFMARYGKQVSSKILIIPCMYRNYLCFAKIEF